MSSNGPTTPTTAPASPAVSVPTVPPEFVIKREGRDFILYRGLLALAHEQGLESITVEVLQYPSAENNQTTVCRATVVTKQGRFTEIGDANAQNTGRLIAQHAMRMAATRSKARALRDAVNVGLVAIEELGGDDAPAAPPPVRESAPPAAPAPPPAQGAAPERIRVGNQTYSREQVWEGYSARRVAALNAGVVTTSDPLASHVPTDPLRDLVASAQRLRKLLEPPPELEGDPEP